MDSRRPRSELPAPEKTVNTRGGGVPPTQGAPRSGAAVGREQTVSCLGRMYLVEGGLAGPKLESRVSLIPEPRLRCQYPRAGKQTLLLG